MKRSSGFTKIPVVSLIALIIALLAVFSLTACGKSGEAGADPDEAGTGIAKSEGEKDENTNGGLNRNDKNQSDGNQTGDNQNGGSLSGNNQDGENQNGGSGENITEGSMDGFGTDPAQNRSGSEVKVYRESDDTAYISLSGDAVEEYFRMYNDPFDYSCVTVEFLNTSDSPFYYSMSISRSNKSFNYENISVDGLETFYDFNGNEIIVKMNLSKLAERHKNDYGEYWDDMMRKQYDELIRLGNSAVIGKFDEVRLFYCPMERADIYHEPDYSVFTAGDVMTAEKIAVKAIPLPSFVPKNSLDDKYFSVDNTSAYTLTMYEFDEIDSYGLCWKSNSDHIFYSNDYDYDYKLGKTTVVVLETDTQIVMKAVYSSEEDWMNPLFENYSLFPDEYGEAEAENPDLVRAVCRGEKGIYAYDLSHSTYNRYYYDDRTLEEMVFVKDKGLYGSFDAVESDGNVRYVVLNKEDGYGYAGMPITGRMYITNDLYLYCEHEAPDYKYNTVLVFDDYRPYDDVSYRVTTFSSDFKDYYPEIKKDMAVWEGYDSAKALTDILSKDEFEVEWSLDGSPMNSNTGVTVSIKNPSEEKFYSLVNLFESAGFTRESNTDVYGYEQYKSGWFTAVRDDHSARAEISWSSTDPNEYEPEGYENIRVTLVLGYFWFE